MIESPTTMSPTPLLPIHPSSLRLSDGVYDYEGRLEIYHNRAWRYICNHGWTTQNAEVVCRQLGHRSVVVLYFARP